MIQTSSVLRQIPALQISARHFSVRTAFLRGLAFGAAAAAAVLGLCGSAHAQAAPPPASPWANGPPPWAAAGPQEVGTVVRELDVVKRLPGPALWRVTRGDSEVMILGSLKPLPHLLVWDTTRIANALDGATALLVPPEPKFSVLDSVSLFFNRGLFEMRGETLSQALPPQERARYEHVLALIHAKPDKYEHLKPAVAGGMLIGDWRRAAGLSEAKPISTVEKLAEADHVPIRHIGDFDPAPFARTLAQMSPSANLACFDAAMDDIDRESARAPANAKAWANADLKAIGQSYTISVFDRCLMQSPSFQGLLERGMTQGMQAIEEALQRPGKTVAIVDLNFLLRPGGILDRLKAKGDAIAVPKG
jgi:uncharacterized protein YbaP (TraB family)